MRLKTFLPQPAIPDCASGRQWPPSGYVGLKKCNPEIPKDRELCPKNRSDTPPLKWHPLYLHAGMYFNAQNNIFVGHVTYIGSYRHLHFKQKVTNILIFQGKG